MYASNQHHETYFCEAFESFCSSMGWMKSMGRYSVFAFLVIFAAAASFGACHAVGPSATGNGSGSNWSNMMTLPTAPVRGDTYYLADGSYGSYTPTTANSGTSGITIKKAQSYDYGRSSDGCSNDISAGWNASTMGNSQAVFTGAGGALSMNDASGYYTFDGNGQTVNGSCGASPAVNTSASDCGIKIAASGCSGSTYGVIWLNPNYDSGATRSYGWTLRYLEVVGGGSSCNTVSNSNEHTLFCRNGCNNLTVQHNYFHDSACDFVDTPWGDTVVFDHNHFRFNASSSNCHGQMYLGDGSSQNNYTWSDNLFQDITGTAVWSTLNGGGASNWYIYNNVLFGTSGQGLFDTSNGIIAVINSGSTLTGAYFYDNTIINSTPDYNGSGGIRVENSGTSITWQNNLFYLGQSKQGGDPIAYSIASGSTLTLGYNSYLNTGNPGTTGTADVLVTSGASNPFVNWTGFNFALVGENATWDNGLTLAAPYNVDFAGNSRPGTDGAWDRGAFEYASTQAQAPAPPTNLTATVQ